MSRIHSGQQADDLDDEERVAYAMMVERLAQLDRIVEFGPKEDPPAEGESSIDGRGGMYKGLLRSPTLAAAHWEVGTAITKRHSRPGSYTAYEHEMIDEVVSFDAGHYGLLALHVPLAVAAGIRIEAIEALRDRRDSDLAKSELQLVEFIRQVVAGTVTDESWSAMVARLGGERAVVEYTAHILFLNQHVRFMQAVGHPGISQETLGDMLDGIKEGSWRMPDIGVYETNRSR